MMEIEVAQELIKQFVGHIEELYGVKELTFNAHISVHATEDVKRWGPMHCISAYAFENANKLLKNKIHAERGIPHQVVRNLGTDQSLRLLRTAVGNYKSARFKTKLKRNEILKSFYVKRVQCMIPTPYEPTREELWLCRQKNIWWERFSQCKKIIADHTCYAPFNQRSQDNSFAYLKDKKNCENSKNHCVRGI